MTLNRREIRLLMAAMTIGMAILQAFEPETWHWSRAAIAGGEGWRIISGHFVHVGWRHWGMNVVAMWLLAGLFSGILSWRHWGLALLLLPLFISAGFWWGLPGLTAYAGLSGVLHGIFVFGAARMLGMPVERHLGLVLIGLTTVKLAMEYFTDETAATAAWIGSPVLIEAHQLGAAGGLLLAVIIAGAAVVPRMKSATKLVP
ncbi:MAG TPA: rhombosortase [Fluviicoccus sp.]|nr:rhombosortase [Fluviicoccus sp.]